MIPRLDEEIVQCTYNPSHTFKKSKKQTHELRCPDRVAKLSLYKRCQYNSMHDILREKHQEHERNCPDRWEKEEVIRKLNQACKKEEESSDQSSSELKMEEIGQKVEQPKVEHQNQRRRRTPSPISKSKSRQRSRERKRRSGSVEDRKDDKKRRNRERSNSRKGQQKQRQPRVTVPDKPEIKTETNPPNIENNGQKVNPEKSQKGKKQASIHIGCTLETCNTCMFILQCYIDMGMGNREINKVLHNIRKLGLN